VKFPLPGAKVEHGHGTNARAEPPSAALLAALRQARAHLSRSSATVASHPVVRTPGMEFAEADALEARDRDLAEIDTTLAACEPKEKP